MVIWLIGISGAGKTTLGNKIKKYYDKKSIKSFIIDGDIVRNFYDNDLGYAKQDRIANIKRLMLAIHILEKNDIVAIVCNISPFENLREFARKKFSSYHEIFLKKDVNKAQDKDIKGIYKENAEKKSLVGIDIDFEYPSKSNLTIDVDSEDEDTSYLKIINYLEKVK